MIDLSQLVVSIDTQRHGDWVLIQSRLQSPRPLLLEYRMSIRQSGTGGTSTINQSGKLQSGAASSLVQLNLPAGATCQVRLEVLHNGTLLKQVDSACK